MECLLASLQQSPALVDNLIYFVSNAAVWDELWGGGGIRQEKERVVLSAKGSKPDGNWSLKEAANERKRNECLRSGIWE